MPEGVPPSAWHPVGWVDATEKAPFQFGPVGMLNILRRDIANDIVGGKPRSGSTTSGWPTTAAPSSHTRR